jgi:hypothetical protein
MQHVPAQRHHHRRVRGDQALPLARGVYKRHELVLARLPRVIQVQILGNRALPQRRGELGFLAAVLARGGGGF